MKQFPTTATTVLAAVLFCASVSAQVPLQGPPPSPEEIKAMQEQFMKMMKPVVEKSFSESDADDSDSLDKEEMLEFGIAMMKAQAESMANSGMPVPQPTEDELKQIREQMEQRMEEELKRLDTDESGDVSQDEILKSMFGDDYTGDDEEEEPDSTSADDDSDDSGDSEESMVAP